MFSGLSIWDIAVKGAGCFLFGVLPYISVALLVWGLLVRVRIWRRTGTAGDPSAIPAGLAQGLKSAAGSLFLNARQRPKVTLTALLHICLLLIGLRHLRYFLYPVPGFILAVQKPGLYAGYFFPFLVLVLIWRRLTITRMMFISKGPDFYPLILLLAIGFSGLAVTLYFPADLVSVKTWGRGLIGLRPQIPVRPGVWGFHVLAAFLFIAYIPFSRMVHPLALFFRTAGPPEETSGFDGRDILKNDGHP